MADEWPMTLLGELIDVKHGFAFQGGSIRDEPCGNVLLTPGNFANRGGFKGDKFKYFDGPAPNEFVLQEGDLLVTMTDLSKQSDTLGFPAFVPSRTDGRRYLHNQRLGKILIRDRSHLDLRFLHYLLCSSEYRNEVLASATGTTVKHTSPDRIRRFRFKRPPLPEQRAIGSILGVLDEKMEVNRRMNATLEAMARALFKSWFVDFDPVRAKAEERSSGLPRPLADLFPAALVNCDLGEIPEGWEMGTLRDVCTLNAEVWSKETRPSRMNYVDLSNTKWGRIDSVAQYSQQDAPSRAQRVLRSGDTIVGTVRPGNGSYAYIAEEGLTGSTGFAVLRPARPEYSAIVYLAATARENVEELAHVSDGGTYPAVRPEVVAATRLVRASGRIVDLFAHLVHPSLERIAANERESRTLAALRDALLPKLISGELRARVPEGVASTVSA